MFERTAQCEALAEATNATLEQVAELDSVGDLAAPADAYTQIAQHYQQLDDHLTALAESPDKEFGSAVSTIRAVLRTSARECERYATHLRDLSEATEQSAPARVTSSTRQLQTIRGRMEKNQRSYTAATERVARLCSPQ
jgi:hypothetical protein